MVKHGRSFPDGLRVTRGCCAPSMPQHCVRSKRSAAEILSPSPWLKAAAARTFFIAFALRRALSWTRSKNVSTRQHHQTPTSAVKGESPAPFDKEKRSRILPRCSTCKKKEQAERANPQKPSQNSGDPPPLAANALHRSASIAGLAVQTPPPSENSRNKQGNSAADPEYCERMGY